MDFIGLREFLILIANDPEICPSEPGGIKDAKINCFICYKEYDQELSIRASATTFHIFNDLLMKNEGSVLLTSL